jgi:hypothetical protein
MASARRRRRASPADSTARAAIPFQREQTEALRYTAKWYRVLAWAERAIESMQGFEPATFSTAKLSARVKQLSASRVFELRDSEEAYERGLPLEEFANLPRGPRRAPGGYRRVIINAYTWVPDHEAAVGYDPAWITLGWGMTAHEAVAAAHRFVKDYGQKLERQIVSRELLVTAFEVKFWTASSTASSTADYL